MVEQLEVRSLRERVAPISVAHYEGMGERINGQRAELIRGIILEKQPSRRCIRFSWRVGTG